MLSLSPAKLLVVLVVALIVLGPDKLPKLARQLGAAWHDLRKLRERLEHDVRGAFPDLPSSSQVAQAVRSPLSYLDALADKHAAASAPTAGPGEGTDEPGAPPGIRAAASGSAVNGSDADGSAANGSDADGSAANGSDADGSAANGSALAGAAPTRVAQGAGVPDAAGGPAEPGYDFGADDPSMN